MKIKKYLTVVLLLVVFILPNFSLAVTTEEMMVQLKEIQELDKQIKSSSLEKNKMIENKSSSIDVSKELKIQKENQNQNLKKNEVIKNKLSVRERVRELVKQIFTRFFKFF